MTTSSTHRGRRLAATIGVVSLTAMGLAGLSSAALADVPELDFGNIDIDEDASGSIIVHKHEHQTSTDVTAEPDGSVKIPSNTVDGVEFTVYDLLVDGKRIDLTDPKAWDDLGGVQVSGDPCTVTTDGYSKGDKVTSGYTADGGNVTFGDLPIGAYVVCETAAPAEITDKADPFIVTIPFPHKLGWLYDVHVYPKNGITTVVKDIVPQDKNGVGLGSVIQFPVEVTIPAIAPGRDFTSFDVKDELDSRLDPTGTTPQGAASVKVDGVDVDSAFYTVVTSGSTVEVKFDVENSAAQDFLKAKAGAKLEVVFQGVVTELGNGEIENQATVFVNDPDHKNGAESNKVWSNWGDVRVLKVNAVEEGENRVGLEGAKFEVYNAVEPYASSCEGAVPTGDALEVLVGTTTVTEFVSNAAGLVFIPGLFVSDSENDPKDEQFRCYVLKETLAPAGYVTPTGDDALFPITVKIGETAEGTYDLEIENFQQDVPDIPLTGASGQVLMVIGGVALLLLATGIVIVTRRRAAQH